jgi:hypothetical protein
MILTRAVSAKSSRRHTIFIKYTNKQHAWLKFKGSKTNKTLPSNLKSCSLLLLSSIFNAWLMHCNSVSQLFVLSAPMTLLTNDLGNDSVSTI